MYVCGVDPGLSGAVSALHEEGWLVALHDTPVLTLSTSRGTQQEYDVPGMAALLWPYTSLGSQVLIEASQALPKQGVSSTWMTGDGYGLWIGLLAALQLPYTTVRPVV